MVLAESSTIQTKKRFWQRSSLILLVISSVMGVLAFISPTGSIHLGNLYSWDLWIFGYNSVFESGVGTESFWIGNTDLLGFSVVSTVFVIIGIIISIFGVISLLRKKDYVHILAGTGAVMLIGSILFYLISFEVYFWIFAGGTFWGLLFPSFGFYGQLVSGVLMVPAILLTRKSSQYSEPIVVEDQQEKVYNMVKRIIDTKFLPEIVRSRLNIELEVISLRLKGTADIQKKILEFSNEPYALTEFQESLSDFQRALELSPDTQKRISQVDLQLVEQIIEEKDKTKALGYLKEISSHTTALLGEIVKILN